MLFFAAVLCLSFSSCGLVLDESRDRGTGTEAWRLFLEFNRYVYTVGDLFDTYRDFKVLKRNILNGREYVIPSQNCTVSIDGEIITSPYGEQYHFYGNTWVRVEHDGLWVEYMATVNRIDNGGGDTGATPGTGGDNGGGIVIIWASETGPTTYSGVCE